MMYGVAEGPRDEDSPWMVVPLSLIPWAAFMISVPVAAMFVDRTSVDASGFFSSALFYVGFVSLPSMLPIAVGRGRVRIAATAVMTVVASVAAILIVATDDAQAGLAVLIVAYVAIPFALILWIGQLFTRRTPARSDIEE